MFGRKQSRVAWGRSSVCYYGPDAGHGGGPGQGGMGSQRGGIGNTGGGGGGNRNGGGGNRNGGKKRGRSGRDNYSPSQAQVDRARAANRGQVVGSTSGIGGRGGWMGSGYRTASDWASANFTNDPTGQFSRGQTAAFRNQSLWALASSFGLPALAAANPMAAAVVGGGMALRGAIKAGQQLLGGGGRRSGRTSGGTTALGAAAGLTRAASVVVPGLSPVSTGLGLAADAQSLDRQQRENNARVEATAQNPPASLATPAPGAADVIATPVNQRGAITGRSVTSPVVNQRGAVAMSPVAGQPNAPANIAPTNAALQAPALSPAVQAQTRGRGRQRAIDNVIAANRVSAAGLTNPDSHLAELTGALDRGVQTQGRQRAIDNVVAANQVSAAGLNNPQSHLAELRGAVQRNPAATRTNRAITDPRNVSINTSPQEQLEDALASYAPRGGFPAALHPNAPVGRALQTASDVAVIGGTVLSGGGAVGAVVQGARAAITGGRAASALRTAGQAQTQLQATRVAPSSLPTAPALAPRGTRAPQVTAFAGLQGRRQAIRSATPAAATATRAPTVNLPTAPTGSRVVPGINTPASSYLTSRATTLGEQAAVASVSAQRAARVAGITTPATVAGRYTAPAAGIPAAVAVNQPGAGEIANPVTGGVSQRSSVRGGSYYGGAQSTPGTRGTTSPGVTPGAQSSPNRASSLQAPDVSMQGNVGGLNPGGAVPGLHVANTGYPDHVAAGQQTHSYSSRPIRGSLPQSAQVSQSRVVSTNNQGQPVDAQGRPIIYPLPVARAPGVNTPALPTAPFKFVRPQLLVAQRRRAHSRPRGDYLNPLPVAPLVRA